MEHLYNKNFKTTQEEGALVFDLKQGSRLSSDEFLSDNELYYL